VYWADDVVILDSFSTDGTERVARERGCRFYQRKYDGRGPHQNWAMEHIAFKHRWVFYLDADERMTPELRSEITAIADDPLEKRVAFYCGRKNYFGDAWLKYSMPPGHIMRFFQPRHIRFKRLANPVPLIDGPFGYLEHHFLHDNFSKGLGEWFERHNRYSTYEAIETIKALEDRGVHWRSLMARDPSTRRMELKNLSLRLPGRPFFKFIYMYFIKLGLLDGRAGLTYCLLQAIYEYQIALKVREMQRTRHTGQVLFEQRVTKGPRTALPTARDTYVPTPGTFGPTAAVPGAPSGAPPRGTTA
jgi:glycosyltransferase involved in cell wall biosynthesis